MSFFKAVQHAAKRLHTEALFHRVKLVLDRPGIVEINSGDIDFVFVLNDAVDGYVRHGEGQSHDLEPALLQQYFLKRFTGKLDDLPVRTDSAGLQSADGAFRRNRNLDVRVTGAFVIQHLDAPVKKFGVLLVIDIVGIVKLDGGRSGNSRHGAQTQVLLRDGKPVFFLGEARQRTKKKDGENKAAQHQRRLASRRNIALWQ